MTFFKGLADMAADLLKPEEQGGLGAAAGSIVLVREVPGVADPSKPWLEVEPTTTRETLKAHSFGVSQQLIGSRLDGSGVGETIIMGDQFVISAIPSIDWKQGNGVTVKIEIDGILWQVMGCTDIPAAGTRSVIKFLVRK
jgi:hypothetical protein